MNDDRSFKSPGGPSPQEEFWRGSFGREYITRNQSDLLLAADLVFFARALGRAGPIDSCVELGANIGMNLKALKLLYPGICLTAVEINEVAARELGDVIGSDNVFHGSILDWAPKHRAKLSLIKGVLIHVDPKRLSRAYERLYESSSRYILIAEYYNPSPVAIDYRGHSDRLFKRDFAGEILDIYSDLRLIDYGFNYRRDPNFPQDDISWFLLEKEGAENK